MSRRSQLIAILATAAVAAAAATVSVREVFRSFAAQELLRDTPSQRLIEEFRRKGYGLQKALDRGLSGSDKFVRAKSAWALGEIRAIRSARKLAAALSDAYPFVQEAAYTALRKIGPQAAPALVEHIRACDMAVNGERIASLLAEVRTPAAVASLRVLAVCGKLMARENAALALGRIGDTAATAVLIAALERDSLDVQIAAAQALGELRAEQAVEPLRSAARSAHPALQAAAVRALGRIGDTASADAILGFLTHSDTAVVRASLASLERLRCRRGLAPLAGLVREKGRPWRFFRAEICRALAACAAGHTAELIPLLADADPDVRVVALEIAVSTRDSLLLPALIVCAQQGLYEPRKRAIAALGGFGARSAPTLLSFLDDTNMYIRRDAIRALGLAKDRRAADALLSIIRRPTPQGAAASADVQIVKQEAMTALGRMGEMRAAPDLRRVVASRASHAERTVAAEALGMLGDTGAVDCLVAALSDSSADLSSRIVGAHEWDVRVGAAHALGAIGDRRAAAALAVAMSSRNPRVRAAALKALSIVDKIEFSRAVERARRDPDKTVRACAEELAGAP